VEGQLAFRQVAGPGSVEDAEVLSAIPLLDYYEAQTEEARKAAVDGLLSAE
jgi:hypothetical protein